MALRFHELWGVVRLFYDDTTNERWIAVLTVAWEALSKWNVCTPIQWWTNNRMSKVPISWNNNDTPCGVALTAAAWAWSTFWLCTNWNIQVLPETWVTPTLWYVMYCSWSVAWTSAQSATAPATATHFKEIWHWLETVAINTIALATIHFN